LVVQAVVETNERKQAYSAEHPIFIFKQYAFFRHGRTGSFGMAKVIKSLFMRIFGIPTRNND
ncbi:MAG TPA: hypothetical protein VK890_01430, partial [Bacteroidia bacterium]|nr:hypothetical protein [Bacteroidia bacterium]